ncbi:hypothetical protein EDD17DRAFT_1599751 [Pisolithus thermaeus]|nr:hypothetical protein EV401DRAFT_2019687 [Pisolithus croceorrhizus]KAI6160567.1 hypothetical protein EDD17DRAFT_1599751 [Pisolithus thermaeus]
MSAAEALSRIFVRLPKLLVIIAKRCSSMVLHLLRYLLSLWNALVQKWKPLKRPLEGKANINSLSGLPGVAGEKVEEVSASVENTTTLCSEDESSDLGRKPDARTSPAMLPAEARVSDLSIMQSAVPSSVNLLPLHNHPPPQAHESHLQLCEPPLKKGLFASDGLTYMLMFLDHPGFVQRSLKDTQHHRHTDIDKWNAFCETFQKDVENINLLATVLLSGNVSFLSIIASDGLSYWPQKLSYVSLLAALGSILMGLAVRTPRFFTAHSPFYFKVMVLVLGFPFELFLYSIVFFIAALIVHFGINAAMLEIYAAVVIMSLVIVCLFLYWLVTEPLEGRKAPCGSVAPGGQA